MAEIDILYTGKLATRCVHRDSGAEIYTAAPKDNQGEGNAFSPTDLLATALGSCVLTLMGIAARKLSIDITGTKVIVTKEMSAVPPRKISKLKIVLTSPHRFDAEITQKLIAAGEGCPVSHSLHPDLIQEFIYRWGEES